MILSSNLSGYLYTLPPPSLLLNNLAARFNARWIILTIRFDSMRDIRFNFWNSFLIGHVCVYIYIYISNSIISKINKMKRRKGKDLFFFRQKIVTCLYIFFNYNRGT